MWFETGPSWGMPQHEALLTAEQVETNLFCIHFKDYSLFDLLVESFCL